MLVLTRQSGEDILIGTAPNQIRVRVGKILGDKVRLVVDAPRHVPVHRKEVADAIAAGREHVTVAPALPRASV